MTLTVGSLFSGIGGLDLGLERAGMKVIWQSEIDPYASKVLNKHWAEVPNYGDIKKINWEEVERPDVICGGYPCQPFSTAGKRRGEEDPRHLWPWVREAISQLRPRYAILENVRGHLSMGGLSVIAELASIGYDAEWRIISAASVGANHRRDRIIIVAYPNDSRPHTEEINPAEGGLDAFSGLGGCGQNVADSNYTRLQRWSDTTSTKWQGSTGHTRESSSLVPNSDTRKDGWGNRSFQQSARTVFSGADNGQRTEIYAGWQWWETEPDVGRVADGVPARVDRLKCLGNAVVPQVAEVVGRLVMHHAETI
jgi:DNA (cytosine-5)-methyltransferase 1